MGGLLIDRLSLNEVETKVECQASHYVIVTKTIQITCRSVAWHHKLGACAVDITRSGFRPLYGLISSK